MEPDKAKQRKPHRHGYEVADDRGKLGRTRQRRMLQQQVEPAGSASSSAHGEDSSFDTNASPPQHDRAG